jgi:hypothetical protein
MAIAAAKRSMRSTVSPLLRSVTLLSTTSDPDERRNLIAMGDRMRRGHRAPSLFV